MSKKTEIEALIRLLDDEDEVIVENVTNKLLSYGEEVVFNLENSWEVVGNSLVQERIESIIHQINFNEVYKDLEKWNKSKNPDLYAGTEIVAKYQFPDLDSEDIKTAIEAIRQKIWLEINNELTPLELVSVFNHIFFGQFGFNTKVSEEPDINDFCINYVLEAKKGSAILIGIVYVLIAQDLNLPIYGVNLYNHFCLTYQKNFIINFKEKTENESMFYINPLNKGTVFGRQEIVTYLGKIKKEKEDLYFKAADNKMIIKELLVYIESYFKRFNQIEKQGEIEKLLDLFR